MVPVLFFLVFILAIAQSAITLKTYADTKKEQDSNYKFSIFFLIFSILGLLVSGFMVYKAGKGDPSPNNAAAATTQLANKLNNLAEQIKQKNN
jgi:heme/copper-type cytochrome/quinol oxidase subunit 2